MEPIEYIKKIENAGFSAYIVGGYVRDKLLGIDSTDVDIASSARPKDIARIFETPLNDTLGSINITSNGLNIDITTYRKEMTYSDRHPEIEYIDDIKEDLKRRDFTINAICMASDGSIFDPLNGREDLRNGIIRVIGDTEKKFIEDPLRMLRAVRFAIVYDMIIEKEAMSFILAHGKLLKTISYERKKKEIDKILLSEHAKKGLQCMKEWGLLECLDLSYIRDYRNVNDLIGSWAQLECSKYSFSKLEKARIDNIRSIVTIGKINMMSLFEYGIYDNIVAADILNIDKNAVYSLYDEMPIHQKSDLAIDGNTIKTILHIDSGPAIKEIKKCLIREVLSGNLPNSEHELINYIKTENWK